MFCDLCFVAIRICTDKRNGSRSSANDYGWAQRFEKSKSESSDAFNDSSVTVGVDIWRVPKFYEIQGMRYFVDANYNFVTSPLDDIDFAQHQR